MVWFDGNFLKNARYYSTIKAYIWWTPSGNHLTLAQCIYRAIRTHVLFVQSSDIMMMQLNSKSGLPVPRQQVCKSYRVLNLKFRHCVDPLMIYSLSLALLTSWLAEITNHHVENFLQQSSESDSELMASAIPATTAPTTNIGKKKKDLNLVVEFFRIKIRELVAEQKPRFFREVIC